ncbi:MAG: KpsF/GutQ family sugar-phosphate isomerase [Armatimonadetes bacterium]|nr:KpsF/GutQ family sugar-phosphate isomerase [Armatimonadota bacterium]
MKDNPQVDRIAVLNRAADVLRMESAAVSALADRLGNEFVHAVEMILNCAGRLVITGMGKSGAIGRKLAGTFSSTGTPALFLHPAEGVHGDLGVVTADDVVLAFSYSGESEELVNILPAIARTGASIIAMVGNTASTLASYSQSVLDVSVEREACPFNLAPTASTTAMLAMGDALALAVMESRRFTRDDFARIHPAGALGRRLLLRVQDVMRTGDAMAIVPEGATLHDVLFCITRAGAGAACVVDKNEKLVGFITDGDIRRSLLKDEGALKREAHECMSRSPKIISPDRLAAEGLKMMEGPPRQIGEIPVLDEEGCPVGVLMLKDLLRAGIF